MIVTCEECTTSFQLDEARIPPGGARVRCSRCKHAFFLPSPTEADPVHAIAAEAAADPAAGMPATSEDLGSTWDGLSDAPIPSPDDGPMATAPSPAPAVEAAPPAPPAPALDDDEEEWQFSEEVRTADDELDGDFGGGLQADDLSAEVGGDLDFGSTQDFSEGFDADALSDEVLTTGPGASGVDTPEVARTAEAADASLTDSGLDLGDTGARDESGFGTVDDFSSLMEDDDGGTADPVADLASELAAEMDEPPEASGRYASVGHSDDLADDPESWDLVAGNERPAQPSRPTKRAVRAPVEATDLFSADVLEDDPDAASWSDSALVKGPLAIAGRVVGWSVSLLAIGAVAFFAMRAEEARFAPGVQTVVTDGMSARTADVAWVETAHVGPVLRFEGEVENLAGDALWPGRVQLVLLDTAGERLPVAPFLAGGPLSETALRESSPAVFAEAVASAHAAFVRRPLGQGERRAFEVLVPKNALPQEAGRALLEVVSPDVAGAPAAATAGIGESVQAESSP